MTDQRVEPFPETSTTIGGCLYARVKAKNRPPEGGEVTT